MSVKYQSSSFYKILQRGNLSESLPIKRSDAKSWIDDDISRHCAPEKVYDGDFETFYATKDDDAAGNFLKLYLVNENRIGVIKLTNRDDCCRERIIGTVVMLYSTKGGGETKVSDCGEITSAGNQSLMYFIATTFFLQPLFFYF